ncbi:hypothetical protein JMJ56_32010 [Belnapia sp. T18]|uniref:Uncharacterized protein n=1 Tax=Belnapia arida TaxID=2804533 RepID=A0ABS1UD29_9PROT|nr:hypothetical protein [Belnapia arida]MBL6082592.1 hypothetical protein [Belnapia arida]
MNRRIMLGAALLTAAAGGTALASPVPVHPDAALIALCQAHPALVDALNSDDRDCDDSNPHWVAYEASGKAISAARPQTLAGMRAKALAAKAEALMPDGSESYDGTTAGVWASDLLHDVLRLTGGAA